MPIALILLGGIAGLPQPALAGQEVQTVAYGTAASITGPDGVCRQVTNNSPTGHTLMVPTQTIPEWQTFYNSAQPAGVSLNNCPCGGYVYWDGGNNAYGVNYRTNFGPYYGSSTFTVTLSGGSVCTQWCFGICCGSATWGARTFNLQCTPNNAIFILPLPSIGGHGTGPIISPDGKEVTSANGAKIQFSIH